MSTDDSPDMRVQRLAVRPQIINLFRARNRCLRPPRRQPAAELPASLEGGISGHQSFLTEVRQGTERNAELKLRLRLWQAGEVSELMSKILGQQHCGPLRRRK